MAELRVEIVRFVDDHQPVVVTCEFTDADENRHTIIEKVPVVSRERLNNKSRYPRLGGVRCRILDRFSRSDGVKVMRISTGSPDHVKTVEGRTEFLVVASDVDER